MKLVEVWSVFWICLTSFLAFAMFCQMLSDLFKMFSYKNENKLLKKEIEILKKQLENKKETEKNDNK